MNQTLIFYLVPYLVLTHSHEVVSATVKDLLVLKNQQTRMHGLDWKLGKIGLNRSNSNTERIIGAENQPTALFLGLEGLC